MLSITCMCNGLFFITSGRYGSECYILIRPRPTVSIAEDIDDARKAVQRVATVVYVTRGGGFVAILFS